MDVSIRAVDYQADSVQRFREGSDQRSLSRMKKSE
jgi:hypothetical protein